jgi:mono/diheme cytochrome c family protein
VQGTAPASNAAADANVMTAGKAIYQDLCSSCHQLDGKGVPNMFPNLSQVATVSASDPATVLRVILQGVQSVATDREPTGPAMPAFGWQLGDEQVAAVATYIRSSWGKRAPSVSEEQVRKARATLAARLN